MFSSAFQFNLLTYSAFNLQNYRRVAEVWMDEYAEYLYKRRPSYRNIDPGNLTEQKAIRKRLNCKPFKWFMKEVAFDLTKVYPPVEPPDFASGKVSFLNYFLFVFPLTVTCMTM